MKFAGERSVISIIELSVYSVSQTMKPSLKSQNVEFSDLSDQTEFITVVQMKACDLGVLHVE